MRVQTSQWLLSKLASSRVAQEKPKNYQKPATCKHLAHTLYYAVSCTWLAMAKVHYQVRRPFIPEIEFGTLSVDTWKAFGTTNRKRVCGLAKATGHGLNSAERCLDASKIKLPTARWIFCIPRNTAQGTSLQTGSWASPKPGDW